MQENCKSGLLANTIFSLISHAIEETTHCTLKETNEISCEFIEVLKYVCGA
jgi:hypothetical protein